MASVARPKVRAAVPVLDPVLVQWLAAGMAVIATVYTAMFAMLVARGVPLGFGLVSLAEIVLLSFGIVVIALSGIKDEDWAVIGFAYAMLTIALLVSIQNNRPMIETVRMVLIIGVFSLMGQRITGRLLNGVMISVSIAVLAVLLLEVAAVEQYVALFQPANFYEATRGVQNSEYNQTGLFNNATSFAGRFSFGLFNAHRTSSIFLEQVSNANFACVLALYVSCMWETLARWIRWLCLATIFATVVTTNGRFASMLMVTILVGHFVFPRLPRKLLPLVTLGFVVLFMGLYFAFPDVHGDDFLGRFAHAGRNLANADASYFVGAEAWLGLGDRDAGYSYLIGTTSLLGMAVIWAFVNFYPRADDPSSRRLAWGLVIYFFGQLVVSSTSLLSIKTAGLLWLLVGFVRVHREALPVKDKALPRGRAPARRAAAE